MEFISRDAIDYSIAGYSLADLINYNEQLVLQVMREIYSAENAPCTCSVCLEDVYALSLNSISPRYIQATSVRSYQSSPDFIDTEAVRAKVLDAVERVRQRPNH